MAAKETEVIFKSLPKMVNKTGVEALILDPVQFFVELAAIKLGMPYLTVPAALYLDYSGYAPLCIYDWPHETTPEALVRNQEGVVKFTGFTHTEGIKAYAREAGLNIDWDFPSGVFSKLACITQSQRSLTLRTRCCLHSFITRVHSMMAKVGPKSISPGID